MKKGINYRAFPSEMRIEKVLKLAKEAGFDGLELNMDERGEVTLSSTKERMKEIARTADKIGIELISLSTKELYFKYSLTDDEPTLRNEAKRVVRKQLELASYAGLDTILVVPGSVDIPGYALSPVFYDIAYQRSFETLKELLGTAQEYKVNMSIETILWNKFLLSPLEIRDFVDKLQSEYISIYFDVGNVQPFGYPEHWIRILGKRIRRVHIKDFRGSAGNFQNPYSGYVGLLEGDTNWPRVTKALREVGYDGYLIAEPLEPIVHYPDYLIYQTSMAMDRILKC